MASELIAVQPFARQPGRDVSKDGPRPFDIALDGGAIGVGVLSPDGGKFVAESQGV